MNLSIDVMEREKQQRLHSLEIAHFQLHMDLAAYEANEDTIGIEQTAKKIISCEKSYNAISALKIGGDGA